MSDAEWLFNYGSVGTPVYINQNVAAVVPLDTRAIGDFPDLRQ